MKSQWCTGDGVVPIRFHCASEFGKRRRKLPRAPRHSIQILQVPSVIEVKLLDVSVVPDLHVYVSITQRDSDELREIFVTRV